MRLSSPTSRGGVFPTDLITEGFSGLTYVVESYPELDTVLENDPDFFGNLDIFDWIALSYDAFVFAAATPMTAEEYLSYQREVAASIREQILDDEKAPDSLVFAAADTDFWTNLYLASLTESGLLRAEDEPPEIRLLPEFFSTVTSITAALLGNAAGQTVTDEQAGPFGSLVPFFEKVRRWTRVRS